MRINKRVIAIDESDYYWLQATANKLGSHIIDMVRTMVAYHKTNGVMDVGTMRAKRALERIQAQKEHLRLKEEALIKELRPAARKRRPDSNEVSIV